MPFHKIGNLPAAALRWSLERAVEEFGGCSAVTLRKLLKRSGAEPNSDGTFSTSTIASAIYGSLHNEKLATQRETTKKLQLENAITESSVLDRKALSAAFGQLADALRSTIMNAPNLSREAKEDFLHNLASWPIILDDVAGRQSKLKRSKNGRQAG